MIDVEPLSRAVALLATQVAGLRADTADAHRRDLQRIDRDIADLRVELAGATTRVLRHTLGIIIAAFVAALVAWLGATKL